MNQDPMTDFNADQVLDGNALAGALEAAFGADVTTVPGLCAHCGAVNLVGELRAFVRAPGAILRCPACDGVIIRVVETSEATYGDVDERPFVDYWAAEDDPSALGAGSSSSSRMTCSCSA